MKTEDLSEKWYYNILVNVEKEWRDFLASSTFPRNYSNACLLFTDRVKENNTDLKGVDFYLTRVMDGTIVDNEPQTCLLVYGKFNRFIFWSVLKKYGDEDKLETLSINPIKGAFKFPQSLDYFPINSFLGNRIRGVSKMAFPSEEQQEKIEKEILKNPKAFWDSDIGKSLYNDNFNLNKDII